MWCNVWPAASTVDLIHEIHEPTPKSDPCVPQVATISAAVSHAAMTSRLFLGLPRATLARGLPYRAEAREERLVAPERASDSPKIDGAYRTR